MAALVLACSLTCSSFRASAHTPLLPSWLCVVDVQCYMERLDAVVGGAPQEDNDAAAAEAEEVFKPMFASQSAGPAQAEELEEGGNGRRLLQSLVPLVSWFGQSSQQRVPALSLMLLKTCGSLKSANTWALA